MSNKPRPEAYSDLQKEIGERIRWARELVVPNRAQFAREIGIDRSTVAHIESGNKAASIFNVLEFAQRLRVSADYILRGSMLGVDPELSELLLRDHPELRVPPRRIPSVQDTPHRGRGAGTAQQPRKQA